MLTTETNTFTRDVLGRYTCNTLGEALDSANQALRPDARPFDIIVIGGGSFAGVLAQHLLYQDTAHSHRILVLEAGRFLLPEHVQNLPMMGLNVPGPTTVDPGSLRNEAWGLPWRSSVAGGFPGLAYCLGGRSVFFGGWSPQLLNAELQASWPAAVINELTQPLPGGVPEYFRQASVQLGTNETNDFIDGPLHQALRQRLFTAITGGQVPAAVQPNQLPLHLDNIPPNQQQQARLEAPLAVQGRPPRSGFFPLNKFSAVPLLMEAARAAQTESAGDDVKKRLLIVPDCHVTRLVTATQQGLTRVTAVLSNKGAVSVPDNGVVVVALGTIESTRLALISFPAVPTAALMGQNLLAHLRSNLTIRIPRAALPANLPNNLQASALFVKGQHTNADGSVRYFHLQITAAGLDRPGTDSEAELFKKIPDVDTIDAFHHVNDTSVVITVRGIGEMEPRNPASRVTLAAETDEFGLPRAFVAITPTDNDQALWSTMDGAADDVASVFANGQPYEVLRSGSFAPVPAGGSASTVAPFVGRRDGLGTTHHEAGPLWLGTNPATSVTNTDARFHDVANAYVAGPALFPSTGSPNPMLTGTALARRLANHLTPRTPPAPDPGFTLLFDGVTTDRWRMTSIKNQPGRDDPGHFIIVDGALEAVPGSDLGLFWYTVPTPPDFVLKLEWRSWRDDDNSGVFIRFPHPDSQGYDNTAFVGVDGGFEVQIDQRAAPDGVAMHKTAAIYNFAGPQNPDTLPVRPLGQWNAYEIHVQGQTYRVILNGTPVTNFVFVPGSDIQHPGRGLPSTAGQARFIGLQTHTGRVAFRNIQIQ